MRIRIGNDITIRLDIYRYNDGLTSENTTGSIAEDLTNAINLTVKLGIYGRGIVSTLTEVTANVNLLTVHVPKELTPQVGKYYVVLDYDKTNIELDDKLQHYRLDSYAFDLVSYTASADAVTDIAIESQLVAGIDGINGLSAYELAVHYEGFTGTVEEYLASLRHPAIEAKEEVDVALAGYEGLKNQLEDGEEARIYNEQFRVSSETARTSAETARVNNETARVEAEEVRESAEGNRVDAEAARVTAEGNRTTSEASRVTAETARATAETTRVSAESQRVANENARGENEGSRVDAETAREAAEDNRVSAESARGINEASRVAAETARAGAEVTRVNNETNRVAAEQARVAFFDTVSGRITELEAQRLCYGVEFTRGIDPAMTRWIGDTAYQSSHPVMAMFKVAKVKDGKVTGYFNQVNLFKMEDGTDSNIIIDGTIVTDDGSDVMLVNESPIYVLNGGTNETYERRLVGKVPFVYDGDAAIEIPAHGVCID